MLLYTRLGFSSIPPVVVRCLVSGVPGLTPFTVFSTILMFSGSGYSVHVFRVNLSIVPVSLCELKSIYV